MTLDPSSHPPLPVADPLSDPFWEGVTEGKLLVQRCAGCRRYQFPPKGACSSCAGELVYEAVSGRGTVYSFTETVSGARHPYFQALSPYLVGLVRLDEQDDLILASNFPGSSYDELAIGAPVAVEYQALEGGAVIPQFRLTGEQR